MGAGMVWGLGCGVDASNGWGSHPYCVGLVGSHLDLHRSISERQ